MRIVGYGIDSVCQTRIEGFLKSRERWAEGIFSAAERELAGEPETNAAFYAGRFAGKEAVAKALGTGFADGVTVHAIEILRLPSDAPYVRLSGGALERAAKLGVTGWFISISHCRGISTASAIAAADGTP
jgi:holo-[acyl-carrier protein] synthase